MGHRYRSSALLGLFNVPVIGLLRECCSSMEWPWIHQVISWFSIIWATVPGCRKLNAQYAQLWDQMSLEFSSSLAYSRANPNVAFSSYRQAYQLDRASGNWTHLGVAKTDSLGRYFGNFDSSHAGPPHVVRLGANDFFYFPAGDSLAIYRVVPGVSGLGPTLKLASVLGGSGPGPDGLVGTGRYLWDWHDTQGDGQIQYTPASKPGPAGEVNLVAVGSSPDPNWKWTRDSYEVDDFGRVWIASNQRAYVPNTTFPWEVPLYMRLPCQP